MITTSTVIITHTNEAEDILEDFDPNGGISQMIIITEKKERFRLMVNSQFKECALMESLTKDNKINYNMPVQKFSMSSDVVLFMLTHKTGKHKMML